MSPCLTISVKGSAGCGAISGIVPFAPRLRSNSTTCVFPPATATSKAVRPNFVFESMAAPASSSRRAASTLPELAASISGVQPLTTESSDVLGFAPDERRSRRTAKSPRATTPARESDTTTGPRAGAVAARALLLGAVPGSAPAPRAFARVPRTQTNTAGMANINERFRKRATFNSGVMGLSVLLEVVALLICPCPTAAFPACPSANIRRRLFRRCSVRSQCRSRGCRWTSCDDRRERRSSSAEP